jgi:hypothetical protein
MATSIRPEDIPALQASVSPSGSRRSLYVLLLCTVLALLVLAIYTLISVSQSGTGQPIMPLDDAYIHFQYAHQIASGQFYVYNPGSPPTSGATSFLYPYVLAIGDLLGLRGLSLGFWAMGIGAAALALSAYLIYRMLLLVAPFWLAAVIAAAFTLDGWIDWHFMSGMETGLAILFVLLTLYAVLVRRFRLSIVAMTLLALIRPEGGLLALIATLAVLLQAMSDIPLKGRRTRLPPRWTWRREWLLLLIPVLAIGVQPAVNLLVTGSPVATGNAAKSLFGIIPYDLGVIVGRILDNFVRMWREFLTGYLYVFALALIGWFALLRDKRFRLTAAMLALWLLAGTAAISTLDTAFWHFKRYQMPLIALFFPLAGWGWAFVYARFRRGLRRIQPSRLYVPLAIFGVLIAISITSILRNSLLFISNEALNVGYVAAQPLQMARWIAANTPPDARIAVHDVGMMRYMGERTTLDIVGLTTPGAAAYWRNGPGSVGEWIERMRPDYIASYGEGHGVGLGYLQNTSLYADPLATYTVSLDPANNVALAAPTQGIYRPDWTPVDRAATVQVLPQVAPYLDGFTLTDTLDVADLDSEAAHAYQWREDHPPNGFPTEYNQFDTIGCLAGCAVMDGGRRINGEESFTLITQPGQDLILVTRLHSADAGTFDVYANDLLVATRVIPSLPGAWLEVPMLIRASFVTEATRIRIVPHTSGDYMPYYHWAYQGNYPPYLDREPIARTPAGEIQMYRAGSSVDEQSHILTVDIGWNTLSGAQGDYKIFVHVVDADGQNVAQADVRPGRGALPPGNWLPGGFRDTITVDLSGVAPGTYRVFMGMYDPITGERVDFGYAYEIVDRAMDIGQIEVK